MSKEIREEFEKETGANAERCGMNIYPSKYTEWLEKKIEHLNQPNQTVSDDVIENYAALEYGNGEAEFIDGAKWMRDKLTQTNESELKRLYEWLMDENRENANTKFTNGELRNVAREIEFRLSNSRGVFAEFFDFIVDNNLQEPFKSNPVDAVRQYKAYKQNKRLK